MYRVPAVVFVLLLSYALPACSTSGGGLYYGAFHAGIDLAAVISSSLEDDDWASSAHTVSQKSGLEIESRPEKAHIYLDDRYQGLTPLRIEDVQTGRHKLTLKKNGYYTETMWIEYAGGYAAYFITLRVVAGFLKIDVLPPDAELTVDGERLSAGYLHELPVGTYQVRASAFGYVEQEMSVEIRERELSSLDFVLEKAEFALSNLRANRQAFNPRNPGLLGTVGIRFRVTGYGSGRVTILDEQGQEVFRRNLSHFTTWQQSFNWDGRSQSGAPLADGRYTVRLEAWLDEGQGPVTAELTVRIDSSIVLLYRSLWSGSAGLLYAPSTDLLPDRSLQLSSLVMGYASTSGGGADVQVPINTGLRLGLGKEGRLELDASAGMIIGRGAEEEEDEFYLPFFAGAALKYSLTTPRVAVGALTLGSVAQAKLVYQNVYTDILADFSGLSLGIPTSLHWGPLSVVLAPELVVSPWHVSYDPDDTPEVGFYGWVYGRMGLILDFPPFAFGASASLRSRPFNQGLGLGYPVQAALEAHWLIPRTQLFLSLAVAGEFRHPDSFHLLGGGGLGILH